MADYKRFVSYMYEYEDGIKKKNVGYVRVETRDGECRFTIHMQLGGLSEGIFPTYLIYRPKDEMELVYIGDSNVRNQVMDGRLRAKEKNIMDTGYIFSDMGGVLLFLNSGVFYATQWDDKPVILEEVLDALKPKVQPKPQPQENKLADAGKQQEETLSTLKVDKPEVIINLSEMSGDIEEKPIEKPIEESTEESAEESIEKLKVATKHGAKTSSPIYMLPGGYKIKEGTISSRPQVSHNPWELVKKYSESIDLSEDIKPVDKKTKDKPEKDNQNPLAEKIFVNYPRIYPFEDNEITRCVKIEPKDIGSLPSDTWILSNNSFLLHGFYCYHHLIFAEIVDRYCSRYIIGVPGIYHNRERFMARMFGFECFKSIRKRELKQGDFGYWYVDVNF